MTIFFIPPILSLKIESVLLRGAAITLNTMACGMCIFRAMSNARPEISACKKEEIILRFDRLMESGPVVSSAPVGVFSCEAAGDGVPIVHPMISILSDGAFGMEASLVVMDLHACGW